MQRRSVSRALRGMALVMAIGVVLTACGGDDGGDEAVSEETEAATEETEVATEDTTADEEGPAPDAAADFCTAGPAVDAALSTEEPDPAEVEAALTAAEAAAPDELADAVATAAGTVRAIFETGDFELFESEEMSAALAQIDAYYVSDCGFADISITAVDYAYENAPDDVEAGPAVLTLDNGGAELHEAFVIRIDNPDISIDELLALPEEEALTMASEVGGAFAFPGESDSSAIVLDEPGRYAIACFIPVGATPEVAAAVEAGGPEPDGPPHFTQGMVAEFQVT